MSDFHKIEKNLAAAIDECQSDIEHLLKPENADPEDLANLQANLPLLMQAHSAISLICKNDDDSAMFRRLSSFIFE